LGHTIIGTFVEHSTVVLEVRVHPLVINISASFFLQDIVTLQVDLDESLILEVPHFYQLLEDFDVVQNRDLVETQVQIL
jgi:hypothetical protein